MSCSSSRSIEEEKISKIRKESNINKIDYYDNDILFKLLSKYITFNKIFRAKKYNGKIYLSETDFFQKLFKKFDIDINNEQFDIDKLKAIPIRMEKELISLINYKDYLTKLINAEIEILNKEILEILEIKKQAYRNQEITYEFLPDESLKIILNNKYLIILEKKDTHFKVTQITEIPINDLKAIYEDKKGNEKDILINNSKSETQEKSKIEEIPNSKNIMSVVFKNEKNDSNNTKIKNNLTEKETDNNKGQNQSFLNDIYKNDSGIKNKYDLFSLGNIIKNYLKN